MEQETATGITIKGTQDGLTVFVPSESPFREILEQLKEKLSADSAFFRDAELILDLGLRPFQEEEFLNLRNSLRDAGVRLKGLLSDNPITKLMAQEAGIPIMGAPSILHSRVRVEHPVKREREERNLDRKRNAAVFVRKTIRAGQKLHFAGDITILGDVNPGAEIVAVGNIAVFGSLRGMAHAGAEGKRDAVVAALELRPTQLRIADCIARSAEKTRGPKEPELARIQDEKIIIEAYAHQVTSNK